MAGWNDQCDRFQFALPGGWRGLTDQELRHLSHEEGCRVWAGAAADGDDTRALVHVTIVPGSLNEYVSWLVFQSWGRSAHVTRVDGPFMTAVGGIDAALIDYACLGYGGGEPDGNDVLPHHMRLLLVIAEVRGYLYRISLYAAEDELSSRGPEFQAMLDSWLWADVVFTGS